MSLKTAIVELALQAPFIGKHLRRYREYKNIPFAPGHYYSVIPDLDAVEAHEERIYGNESIPCIDLRPEKQMELVKALQPYYASIPYRFGQPEANDALPYRYKIKDAFYRNSDAIFLHAMIRHFSPRRIIEIGSGHSSAIMLDTNEHFMNGSIQSVFVEPFPEERLLAVLRAEDRDASIILKQFIQDVELERFDTLEANDILFVDSSHVSKVDSDVNHIFFNILPRLRAGVLIHFHDIFFPFELPKAWVTGRKWFWNENYLLRAFLMNNPDYEILLFNDYLHKKYPSWFRTEMPHCLIDAENTGSIWIRKLR